MSAATLAEKVDAVRPQRAAAAPDVSAWVAANAGSGKTHVLVQRVTRLMLAGFRPERILCLTFTRAAAAEMANRLYERLAPFATMPDAKLKKELRELVGRDVEAEELAPARRLFARALDSPGGLKIQTIHAFCQALLARFPLEAGVAPHFELMDERTAGEFLEIARDRVLEKSQAGGDSDLAMAMDRIAARVNEESFAEVIQEIARARGHLRRLLEDGVEGAIASVHRTLGLPQDTTPEKVVEDACSQGCDEAALKRACAALNNGSDIDRDRAKDINEWIGADPARRIMLFESVYARAFLTKDKAPLKRLLTKKAGESDASALPALSAEQARVLAAVEMLTKARIAEATSDLLHFAAALLDAYEREKVESARLDYSDLITHTHDLLKEGAAWVLYKLDGGIDHILIDEAQDTSPEQWEIVAALADEFFTGSGARAELPGPRTVFVVGDEKQSIFSFQGADVAAFERMKSYFAHRVAEAGEKWRPVELIVSFRGSETILRAVDQVFARDAARNGIAAPDAKIRHSTGRPGQAGRVEIWPTETPGQKDEMEPWDAPLDQLAPDSPPARVARRIASQIADWIARREILESRGRPIRSGDILILVRKRDSFFDEMVRQLKEHGVPVAGTDRMKLTEQIAVMDLMALGQFLLLPEDDLTLASVLKSPLIGLDEDDLFTLAHGRSGTLWAELKARGEEKPAFRAARDELTAFLMRVDFLTPFALFAWILTERSGRKRLLARLGPDAGDPIDEFLSLALAYEKSHAPSLQGFLHWLAAAPTEIKRDLEQRRDEVRVMTVHGAKGLESEIVFLPDTCTVPDGRHDDHLRWIETKSGPVPLWTPVTGDDPVTQGARDARKENRLAEYRRLLYVAMTRAADRLYVCGYEGERGRAKGCWYDLIADALEPYASEIEIEPGRMIRRLEGAQTAEPKDSKGAAAPFVEGARPSWLDQPVPVEPAVAPPLAPSRPAESEPPSLSPLQPAAESREDALQRGRIVHRLLEILPEIDPSARAARAKEFLARRIHGLSVGAQDEIARETLAILEDKNFAPLFSQGSLAEVPLAGRINDRVIAGQVDRLVVTADEILLVDYKTNRPVPETLADVPVAYLRQMAAYHALLARIYPGRPIACSLLWTVAPRLMVLPDDVLQPYAP